MNRRVVFIGLACLLAAGGAAWLVCRKAPSSEPGPAVAVASRSIPEAEGAPTAPPVAKRLPAAGRRVAEASLAASEAEEQVLTPEERAEAAKEAKVEAFDNLTDKWMEPVPKGVSMKDVEGFVSAFRAIPKDRKDECIHRALNLIPDDNVMLLAGVLMDKSEDKEIVETVFNDILNRDEAVKKPILKQVFADKTHPCWADTAWILDVTGELPAKK